MTLGTTWVSEGRGAYMPGERHAVLYPYAHLLGQRVILYAHQYGSNAEAIDEGGLLWQYVPLVASPVVAGDLAGDAFGNDASTTALEALRVWAQAPANRVGVNGGGPAVVTGGSMGCATAFNYARRYPNCVAALLCVLPLVDVNLLWENDVQGLRAPIEAAYPNGWPVAKWNHNPLDFAPELEGLPMQLWYSSNDTLVPPDTVEAFAATVGTACELVDLGAVGHSGLGFDPERAAVFLSAHLD